MRIYDSFPHWRAACAFAEAAVVVCGCDSAVCSSSRLSDGITPFPFELKPPIVVVDAGDSEQLEHELEVIAGAAGGRYVGT